MPDNCDNFLGYERQLCKWTVEWQIDLQTTKADALPNTLDKDHQSVAENEDYSSPPRLGGFYTLDLIPRQSSLNVADSNSTTSNVNLAGVIKLISGFGIQSKFDRQRNEFSQFIQEETYASAFGKGSYEFGWTFGPLPGTDYLAPGLRTTYAVVVVPKGTRILRMYGRGCGYRRKIVPINPLRHLEWSSKDLHPRKIHGEDCSELNTFDIEVPSGQDNLQVEKAYYQRVSAGKRAIVEIEGRFDEQVGILINGTPLTKVASIAQPNLASITYGVVNEAAGDTGVKGVFEMVSGKQLLASFLIPVDSPNTPLITLVTAGRTVTLTENQLQLRRAAPGPMFLAPAQISRIDFIQDGAQDSDVTVKILGTGFIKDNASLLMIGTSQLTTSSSAPKKGEYLIVNSSIIVAKVPREDLFTAPSVDFIRNEEDGSTTTASKAVEDNLPPYTSGDSCDAEKDSKTKALTIIVRGKFFSSSYKPRLDKVDAVSTKSADKPSDGWVITGTDKGWDGKVNFEGPRKRDAVTCKFKGEK